MVVYTTTIDRAQPNAAGLVWRATFAEPVPAWRNAMRHNVYVNVFDENTRELRGASDVKIAWGWEGQRPDEQSTALKLDKPAPEWMTNIPVFPGQKIWCRVDGRGIPSDTVRGLHAGYASVGDGTAEDHHSFEVVYQLWRVTAQPEPAIEPQPEARDPLALVRLADQLQTLVNVLREIVEYQTQAKG